MDILNLENIDKLPDVPIKEIEIPEWNAKVVVKGLTKKMQIELARISNADDKDAFDYQKALLKASLIKPKLDDDTLEVLYDKDASVIDKIFVEIANINGIGGETQTEMSDEFQD